MTGFEPAASSSRTKRATGLRYIPQGDKNNLKNYKNKNQFKEAFLGSATRAC